MLGELLLKEDRGHARNNTVFYLVFLVLWHATLLIDPTVDLCVNSIPVPSFEYLFCSTTEEVHFFYVLGGGGGGAAVQFLSSGHFL